MTTRRDDVEPQKTRRRPATTVEGREAQLVSLAFDAVEERIRSGKASSQELVHFLKLGTSSAELEKMALEADVRLKTARADSIGSVKRQEDLMREAMVAFTSYSPTPDEEFDV